MARRRTYADVPPPPALFGPDGIPSLEDVIAMANDLVQAEQRARESSLSLNLAKDEIPKPKISLVEINFFLKHQKR